MLFDSPVYLVFLALVVLVYWRLGWRAQNRFLLLASYFFYGWWDWRFLLLMMISTVVDFTLAGRIAEAEDQRRRRMLLTISLVMNFGFLGFFKYCNFFIDSFAAMLEMAGAHHIPRGLLQIILPPGISFYTFQEVAYIVDVYKRRQAPARSLIDYGLFIGLFPHLIAGPIQRPSHLLPQVQRPRAWDDRRFFDGLMLIASGLFRKCVIADQCAVLANLAFAGKLGHTFWSVLIGVYAFAWQIYGDFSGYSDLARGSAQLLGFHFMVNFRQPYFATSLQDFWRRWHISLSTWLRDYLYIPLGGNRKGPVRTYVNLMATMLLGGLWHGANWTFVIWGGIHGFWLALERFLSRGEAPEQRFGAAWRVPTLIVVGLAWIFFRARSLPEAIYQLGGLGVFGWRPEYGPAIATLVAISLLVMIVDFRLEVTGEEYPFQNSRLPAPIATATALVILLALFGAMDSRAFIYFQF
ncbi:MAG TPA: MBOAT family O-acyltransferase [Bryobacteraceae bacterium]|nr:MBOAT family O-acyltransferase [Bryobacteraceae bacterium]